MKAETQYNDFIGTSAADISDHRNLNDFIALRGVDIERYDAIGVSFYGGENNFFYPSVICIDRTQSTEETKHLVKISFEAEFTKDDFFNLFKRFSVVLTNKYGGYQDMEVAEEITFDDREQN